MENVKGVGGELVPRATLGAGRVPRPRLPPSVLRVEPPRAVPAGIPRPGNPRRRVRGALGFVSRLASLSANPRARNPANRFLPPIGTPETLLPYRSAADAAALAHAAYLDAYTRATREPHLSRRTCGGRKKREVAEINKKKWYNRNEWTVWIGGLINRWARFCFEEMGFYFLPKLRGWLAKLGYC